MLAHVMVLMISVQVNLETSQLLCDKVERCVLQGNFTGNIQYQASTECEQPLQSRESYVESRMSKLTL